MYCIIKCIVQGKQARVKNADLRLPSCTVVMEKRKSASPVLNVLTEGEAKTYCCELLRMLQRRVLLPFVSVNDAVDSYDYMVSLFNEN